MSFKFDHKAFNNKEFNELIKKKLNTHLNKPSTEETDSQSNDNSSSSFNPHTPSKSKSLLTNGITVNKVNFQKAPFVEILDLNIQPTNLMVKSIIKILLENASIEISTNIEANSLLMYSSNSTPDFIMPDIICNDSFVVPITMMFSNIQLEAISNICMEKKLNSGLSVSFNDVDLDFDFQCSIAMFQGAIEKRLKLAMDSVFRDVLPVIIYSTSNNAMVETGTETNNLGKNLSIDSVQAQKAISGDYNYDYEKEMEKSKELINGVTYLDIADLEDVSSMTMSNLGNMMNQRNSLSLLGSHMEGCLERPHLYKLLQKKSLQLSNLIHKSIPPITNETPILSNNGDKVGDTNVINNTLPIENLDFNKEIDLVEKIANFQTSIYQRQGRRHKNHVKKRCFKLSKQEKVEDKAEDSTENEPADTMEKKDAKLDNQTTREKVQAQISVPEKEYFDLKTKKDTNALRKQALISSTTQSTDGEPIVVKLPPLSRSASPPPLSSPSLLVENPLGSVFFNSRVATPLPSPSPVPALNFHHWVEDHAMGHTAFNLNNKYDLLSQEESKHTANTHPLSKAFFPQTANIASSPIRPVYKRNHYSFVGISSQNDHPYTNSHFPVSRSNSLSDSVTAHHNALENNDLHTQDFVHEPFENMNSKAWNMSAQNGMVPPPPYTQV
ncbi:hypothetical protein ACO0QE_000876 [Hanseniaspora vineae]